MSMCRTFGLLACALALASAQLAVVVNTSVAQKRLASPYLSFNIDTASLYNGINLLDPVLINLVYALNPLNSAGGVIVRVGGTAADSTYYIPDAVTPGDGAGHTLISDATLEALWSFAGQAHADILWDFNGLSARNISGGALGPWDPTQNATGILEYLNASHPSTVRWSWSLGNEPEFWPVTMNWTQLGVDAHTLSATLHNYTLGTNVYGPSFCRMNTSSLAEYLTAARGAVSGVTFHGYPLGRNCNVTAYLNAKAPMASAGLRMAELDAVRQNVSKSTLLVLEETAGSYDGGCENITDRFLDGFFFTNALGITASSGIDRIHRQDLVGWSGTTEMSRYQLAGPAGWVNGSAQLTPHPSWYLSVLFKTMIGSALLSVDVTGDPNVTAAVGLYAWCSGSPWWFNNSIVISYANPTGADVQVDLSAVNVSTPAPRTEYFVTSDAASYTDSRARVAAGVLRTVAQAALRDRDPPASLTSDVVYLNGQLWQVDDNGILPALPVVGNTVTDNSQPLVLPPYSWGYVQYPGDTVHACK